MKPIIITLLFGSFLNHNDDRNHPNGPELAVRDFFKSKKQRFCYNREAAEMHGQGRTDHSSTRALPEGPGSVGDPMKCPWYLFFIGFFLSVGKDRGPMIPHCPGAP
ncbi:unnamed protein product [Staurois parvus]|uniref:Uncharacterized protein n=1 Tax=Staurois parvus TaxID=386267 RepID=A0ABN9DBN9_9NEOB|nr:unnamed protein product [Staurois parvus]